MLDIFLEIEIKFRVLLTHAVKSSVYHTYYYNRVIIFEVSKSNISAPLEEVFFISNAFC